MSQTAKAVCGVVCGCWAVAAGGGGGGGRVLGRQLFGGRKESFPQLRSPPRSGLLEYSVLSLVLWSFRALRLRLACLRSPPSHNPPPRFQNSFRGVASAIKLLHCKRTAALIL